MNPTQTVDALRAAAPAPLAGWLDRHTDEVTAITRAVASRGRVRAAAGWSLEQAVAWQHAAAERLVEGTYFEGGKMLRDEAGASASTYAALLNYGSRTVNDTDPAVELAASEVLRVHSGRQLDHGEWEAAHEAIQRAYREQYGDKPAPTRIYSVKESAASGLPDGSVYQHRPDHTVRMLLPFRKALSTAKDLLESAGFVKNVDFRWVNEPRGSRTWWLSVDADRVEGIADALAPTYPDLAEALRQGAPVWLRAAGRASKPREAPPEIPDTVDPVGRIADAGRPETFQWELRPNALVFRSPYLRLAARNAGMRFDYPTDKPQSDYWLSLPLTVQALGNLVDLLNREKRPRAAQVVERIQAGIGTATPVEPHATAPGRGGDADHPEGRWEVTPSGYVRLFLPYRRDWEKQDRWYNNKPGTRAIVQQRRRDGAEGRKEWYHYFRAARAWLVAEALAPDFPNTAAALVRAFGSQRREFAADALRCDPLADMSGAPEPAAVRSPVGQAVIADVIERLRARLPMNPKTGKQLFPFPYQVVGIAFAKLTGYRALFGDAPGLGKTIQALGSIVVDPEELLPAVVVAPASVLLKWRDEIQGNPETGKVGWLPHVPTYVLKTGSTPLPPPGWKGILLTTWSLLGKHADALGQWGVKLFIGDESHYIKEPDADRSQAAFALAEQVPHVLLLSGTSLKNNVIELHHQLSLLDAETFGARSAFGEDFTNVKSQSIRGRTIKKYEGTKNVEKLRERLACIAVRRLKSDVLKDLPAKQRVMQPIQLTDDEIKDYNRVAREFETWLYDMKRRTILARHAARAESDPTYKMPDASEIDGEVEDEVQRTLKNEPLVKVGYLRRAMGAAKVRSAVEFITSLVEQGEPVVVFAEHQHVVRGLEDALTKEGISHRTIGGGNALSSDERNRIVNDFQAGRFDVFIGTQAAKEGLDLFRASNTVFVERFWTPADEEQAEDRIHRIGQTRGATIWYLYVPETIDEKMNSAIEAKRLIADQVIGGERIATSGDTDPRPIGEVIADLMSDEGLIGKKAKQGVRGTKKQTGKKNPANALPRTADVQALVFAGKAWTPKTAAHWAQMHGYRPTAVTTGANLLTLQLRDPRLYAPGSFKTRRFTETVTAVVGALKRR